MLFERIELWIAVEKQTKNSKSILISNSTHTSVGLFMISIIFISYIFLLIYHFSAPKQKQKSFLSR